MGDNCRDEHSKRLLSPCRRPRRERGRCEHADGIDRASFGDRSAGRKFVSRRRARGDPDAGEPLVRSCVWNAARSARLQRSSCSHAARPEAGVAADQYGGRNLCALPAGFQGQQSDLAGIAAALLARPDGRPQSREPRRLAGCERFESQRMRRHAADHGLLRSRRIFRSTTPRRRIHHLRSAFLLLAHRHHAEPVAPVDGNDP